MFSTSDTIVAIATPAGRGGLGVVRFSGPDAVPIARELIVEPPSFEPRRAMLLRLRAGSLIDRVVVTWFPSPQSYTTEDVVEISAHGSPVVLRALVREATARGARLARPGEFTFRAFINGRIDLIQAEAVADLIEAVTPRQASAASAQLEGALTSSLRSLDQWLFDLIARVEASLDFPEEGYHFIEPDGLVLELRKLGAEAARLLSRSSEGRLVREGVKAVLVGRPNAGKSSLFNALCRSDRAIVAAAPGTTRDILTESIDLKGVPVTLVDTAGVRDTIDDAEREGVRRASAAAASADLVLLILDVSAPLESADMDLLKAHGPGTRMLIASKSDRPYAWDPSDPSHGWTEPVCVVSAVTGSGIEDLLTAMAARLGALSETVESPAVTNERHIQLLRRCVAALARAADAVDRLGPHAPEEVVLVDLNEAREALDEIAGRRTTDEVLQRIFERFCIGK